MLPISHGELFAEATAHLHDGRPAAAEPLLSQLLSQANAPPPNYLAWIEASLECYRRLGKSRHAGYLLLFLGRFAEARTVFATAENGHFEVARCFDLEAYRRTSSDRAPLWVQAARGYREAHRPVHAALAFAAAGAHSEARRSWREVLQHPALRGRPYEQALTLFNLGRCHLEELESLDDGRRHLVRAQQLLEEVAHDFEARGERERAYDCFAILLQLGKESGSFENLAEGYLNCIRIFKQDHLKYYALQYYEDFLRLALEREEFHAAASICREAADYAQRVGLPFDRNYLTRAGEIWSRAAEANERSGGPIELTENALLAAVESLNSLGDFVRIRDTYQQLSRLPLLEKRRQRYRTIAARYASLSSPPGELPALPEQLRQRHAYPAIWELDLVEWELDGDCVLVASAILANERYADLIRRRALYLVLRQLDANQEQPLTEQALALGELQAYPALRPLERLFETGKAPVRRSVMLALGHLYFKRSLRLVNRGLGDEAPEVQEAALAAVRKLFFPHAFDPLTRIFREATDLRVKTAVLESLGRMRTLEAGEFLIEVLRLEPDPIGRIAQRQLLQFGLPELLPIARQHLELAVGITADRLREILGIPVPVPSPSTRAE